MSGAGHNVIPTQDRNRYGCTVTVRERATGKTRVLVELGLSSSAAVREVARRMDALEGDWCVQAFSTPETIYTDLQGSRTTANSKRGKQSPEALAFTRIGRADLLPSRPPFMRSDGRRRTSGGGT